MTYLQILLPLVLLALAGVLILRRRPSRSAALWCAAALFLLSWQPVAWIALWPLEGSYRAEPPQDHNVGAIVVLASSVLPPSPPLPEAVLEFDTSQRCRYAAWLHKNWAQVPVLASGKGSWEVAYSVAMSEAMKEDGVPASMIWTEEKSRSTYENAVYSAEVLRSHGIRKIALVTEAYHMPRAERCFRKQGIEVVAAPCAFRGPTQFFFSEFIPGWKAISLNEDTLHEVVGLVWYRLSGRI